MIIKKIVFLNLILGEWYTIEFIYSNKGINLLSFIISIIIFLFINLLINNFSKFNFINPNNFYNLVLENNENVVKEEVSNIEEEVIDINNLNWYIEIPSIELKAPIKEGVDDETLNKYVGHFDSTSLQNGNIGLAGHNRSYEKNYFEKLRLVKKGDVIHYKYNEYFMTYIIDTIEIIRSTDWSYLEKYDDENRITLITCVENEPQYRRCVQAVEKGKE